MPGACNDDHLFFTPRDHREVGPLLGERNQPKLIQPLLNTLNHACGVQVLQTNFRLRILTPKPISETGQMGQSHRVNRTHPDGPNHILFVLKRLHPRFERLITADEVLASLIKHLSMRGENQRSLGAINQLDAEPNFQLMHRLAGG